MTINIPKPEKADAVRRRLAKGICIKLRLPQDGGLAHIIGNGTESTSEAAVDTWLINNGVDPSRSSLQDAC
jgi:hypothetical protein